MAIFKANFVHFRPLIPENSKKLKKTRRRRKEKKKEERKLKFCIKTDFWKIIKLRRWVSCFLKVVNLAYHPIHMWYPCLIQDWRDLWVKEEDNMKLEVVNLVVLKFQRALKLYTNLYIQNENDMVRIGQNLLLQSCSYLSLEDNWKNFS